MHAHVHVHVTLLCVPEACISSSVVPFWTNLWIFSSFFCTLIYEKFITPLVNMSIYECQQCLLQQMPHLYQDSPSCSNECLPGSVSLRPQVVGVVVKLRCVMRVLEEGGVQYTNPDICTRMWWSIRTKHWWGIGLLAADDLEHNHQSVMNVSSSSQGWAPRYPIHFVSIYYMYMFVLFKCSALGLGSSLPLQLT